MALNLRLPNDSLVLKAYASLIGAAPGSTAFNEHKAFIAANGQNAYVSALNSLFASVSNADLASAIRANLGLTSVVTQETTEAFLAANASNRVGAIFAVADILATTTDASLAAAKAAYNAGIDAAYNYSVVATNYTGTTIAALTTVSTTYVLNAGFDNLTGTSGADLFNAYFKGNASTLESGDLIDGGVGADILFAQLASTPFAITPRTTNIETVKIQAQNSAYHGANGNNIEFGNANSIKVDAADMQGVTNWENTNSRSDLIIEDVRIQNDQITKDVTITMRNTDPGHVDYGVYFDQNSLRNQTSNSSTLEIRLMDTGAAGNAATAATPLLNNPYDLFKIGINGVLTQIQLDKAAVAAADTYEAFLTVFQNALAGTGVTASLSGTFTITDPVSNTAVTGKKVLLTANAGITISDIPGSGWFNTTGASVPATSNIYTTYGATSLSSTDLVTSKVVLDYVGRGSTGGDLVIGGLSVGDTSTSKGVQRFEILVEDDSKLQTINSTNNTLREVVITNGTTDRQQDAYNGAPVANAGNLTVNGTVGNPSAGASGSGGVNAALPGSDAQHNAYGFSDVRLVDGSAMNGKLAFTAELTEKVVAKYMTRTDTASNPAADNVTFDYKGGANADTLDLVVNSANLEAAGTVTREDFVLSMSGNAGNDTINLSVVSDNGDKTLAASDSGAGVTAWYANQKSNANITIDGGDGNDTINKKGAGDLTINAGNGNDTVYADNAGSKSKWVFNTADQATANAVERLADDLKTSTVETSNLYKGQLTVTFTDDRGGEYSKTITIETSGYTTSELQINNAIKKAIQEDNTLSKLVKAEDGPAGTLVVTSLVDGDATNFEVALARPTQATMSYGDAVNWVTAVFGASHANMTTLAAVGAAGWTVGNKDAVNAWIDGVMADPTLAVTYGDSAGNWAYTTAYAQNTGPSDIVGTDSSYSSDNKINLGAGTDVAVLGTDNTDGSGTLLASNDTIVFTGYDLGSNTIVNFDLAGDGIDQLSFTSYLVGQDSTTGLATRIVTSLNTDSDVEANSVTVIQNPVFAANQTFAGLTAEKLLAAINQTGAATAADYGLTGTTLDAVTTYTATTLVGGVGQAVVMIESDKNDGEYAVFELTFNGLAANTNAAFTGAKLIGYADFGQELAFATGNFI